MAICTGIYFKQHINMAVNPSYKFELIARYNGVTSTKEVFPVYSADIAKEYELESNEMFYRAKLSGKLRFISEDFTFINTAAFETEFELRLYISYNRGTSYTLYWTGEFYKTDCEFDIDNNSVIATANVKDEYSDVIAGIEKEYNLIELKPEITHIQIDKRPMIQIYTLGESTVGCFLSGMYWEQDANTVESHEDMLNKYHFYLCKGTRFCEVTGSTYPDVHGIYSGEYADTEDDFSYTKGEYKLTRVEFTTGRFVFSLSRISGDTSVVLWQVTSESQDPGWIQLQPVEGSGVEGPLWVSITTRGIYARLILDVTSIQSNPTFDIPEEDIVENNRNYSYCYPFFTNNILYSTRFTSTPTEYGIRQPGQYYLPPNDLYEFFPIARSTWNNQSVWFKFSEFDWLFEQEGRKTYTLRDAFSLASVISVLVAKIAPGVTHAATPAYSEFLYSTSDPLRGGIFKLFITQKTNILAGDYDQPAQKAPVTLRSILDMLRDCFRVYWFIDTDALGNKRFRLEHVSWFLNGGSYSASALVGTDLTQMILTRNGKNWAFNTSNYSYSKDSLPERYEFKWMDNVTKLFEGYPIDINSRFVNKGSIENISVSDFTSDIDYMLLNPAACNNDGFALLGAVMINNAYKLPYVNYRIGMSDHYLQNAYMSFYFLQGYYFWDLPARNVTARCSRPAEVQGIKKQKVQDLQYPVYVDPNLQQLVKTNIGDGQIDKMSIKLLSRAAKVTLRYDTE